MSDTPACDALHQLPGHNIRRLQQIAVRCFLDETAAHGVTPVQFALLFAVHGEPGLDQRSVAARIGFDTSTLGGVIDRLEGRGLVRRQASPNDRRVRLLTPTAEGEALLQRVLPDMHRAQRRMLEPLDPDEQQQFMRLLRRIVDAHRDLPAAGRDEG